MTDTFVFTDPMTDATRLDISTYIGGVDNVDPDFGDIAYTHATAESFLKPGTFYGGTHAGMRQMRLPIVIIGASADDCIAKWSAIQAEVVAQSSLKVQLDGATAGAVFFDLGPSVATVLHETFLQRMRVLTGELRLNAYPFARGASVQSLAISQPLGWPDPNNRVSLTGIQGDAEVPADLEFTFAAAPTRLTAFVWRRTKGEPDNYKSTYIGAENYGVNSDVSGTNPMVRTPGNTDMHWFASWHESTNVADKTGLVQVYVVIKDHSATRGQLRAQMRFGYANLSDSVTGPVVTISADEAHLSGAQPEMWYLGTFRIPENPVPSDWYWQLYTQRTVASGSSNISVYGIIVVPIDESFAYIDWDSDSNISGNAEHRFSIKTDQAKAWWGPLSAPKVPATLGGRGVYLKPGVKNNLFFAFPMETGSNLGIDPPRFGLLDTAGVTIRAKPQFAWVR